MASTRPFATHASQPLLLAIAGPCIVVLSYIGRGMPSIIITFAAFRSVTLVSGNRQRPTCVLVITRDEALCMPRAKDLDHVGELKIVAVPMLLLYCMDQHINP